MLRKVVRIVAWIVLILALLFAALVAWNWDMVQRIFLGGVKVYESEAPAMPADIPRPAILVFSKTNGFRHEEAIPVANKLFETYAGENGWGFYQTENGATFSPEILARFDAVVFNNVSGDVFTPEQRAAFKEFVESGKGFVGIHGAGGDMEYAWDWYVDELIGAQFIGHTMDPQFPEATMLIVDKKHPATAGMDDKWVREEEWYSFDASVREKGYRVLATVDETTYSLAGPFGQDIAMGSDHPMVWSHCQGQGRALYSALGHRAGAYAEPEYRQMLLGATRWALRLEGDGCGENVEYATSPEEPGGEQ